MNLLSPWLFHTKRGRKTHVAGFYVFVVLVIVIMFGEYFSCCYVLGLFWQQLWILWRLKRVTYFGIELQFPLETEMEQLIKSVSTRETLWLGPEAKQWGTAWIQALPQLGNSCLKASLSLLKMLVSLKKKKKICSKIIKSWNISKESC